MENYKKMKKGAEYGIPGTAQYELLKAQGKIPSEYIKEMEAKKQLDTSEYERPADLKSIPNMREFPEQDAFAEEKEAARLKAIMEPTVEEMDAKRAKLRGLVSKPEQVDMFKDDPEFQADADEASQLREERKKLKLEALKRLRGE